MKTELTEQQMLSWRPRRASKGLEQRIFAVDHHPRPAKWFWECLVPTTACALLTLMTLNHSRDNLGQRPAFTMTLSSLTNTSPAADDRQSAQNRLVAVTFDSTNHSYFNSNTGFTPSNNFSNE
jgi:hypothetical protein